MGYRVFATQELHPFSAGGIGRVVGNFLAESSPQELATTAVVLCSNDATLAGKVAAMYPELKCFVVADADYETETVDGRVYPPFDAYQRTHLLHRRSVLVMQALLRIERELGGIDYVEFPDWGGMAFASCQEKRLGRGLRDTVLAVRLHTTDGLLASFEQRGTDEASLALFDLERKAIADCDLIVGQLRPVAEYVRQFYGFMREEWDSKLHIHAPSVHLDGEMRPATVRPALNTPITFTSKIQHCKRPDVFVRGCVEFLLDHPEVTAPVRFIAHAFDGAYFDRINALIPKALEGRFQFISGLSGGARTSAIAGTVCVFPTSYESFCLAAYEASLAGALPLLNTSTPAFSPGTPWVSGVNCLGFDGSARGVAEALRKAFFASVEAEPVRLPVDAVPWSRAAFMDQHDVPPTKLRIAAVVAHRNDARGLIDTLDALSAQTHALDEIVLVDGASDEPSSLSLLEQLATLPRLRLHRVSVDSPAGILFARGLEGVTAERIVLMESGTAIAPGFVAESMHALARDEGPDFVTSHGSRASDASADMHEADIVQMTVGEACAFGMRGPWHVPPACIAARTTRVREIGFSHELEIDTWWDFHMRAIAAGCQYVVSSTVDVLVSAGLTVRLGISEQVRQHGALRSIKARVGDVLVPSYALAGSTTRVWDSGYERALADQLDGLLRNELVIAALRLSQFLHYRAPGLLRLLTGSLRAAWRGYKKLRGRA